MLRISISTALTLMISFFITSCGKHVYVMKANEINKLALNAMEPGMQAFVVYANGDSIKGSRLKKSRNIINGKRTWMLDEKDIDIENIASYQDEYGYRKGEFSRLMRNKLSLYMHQVDDSRLVTNYSASSKTFETQMKGGTETSFFMDPGGNMYKISINSLKEVMIGCQQAIKQVDEEFRNTYWNKHPSAAINDYRALVRIFNVYNGQCK